MTVARSRFSTNAPVRPASVTTFARPSSAFSAWVSPVNATSTIDQYAAVSAFAAAGLPEAVSGASTSAASSLNLSRFCSRTGVSFLSFLDRTLNWPKAPVALSVIAKTPRNTQRGVVVVISVHLLDETVPARYPNGAGKSINICWATLEQMVRELRKFSNVQPCVIARKHVLGNDLDRKQIVSSLLENLSVFLRYRWWTRERDRGRSNPVTYSQPGWEARSRSGGVRHD